MTNVVFYLDGVHYFTAEDMDEPKINWIKWLPWGGCSHGGEYIIYDPSYAPTAALSFDECRVGGILPDADRVAANYLVETTDVCEIGAPSEPGDESGVTCSFAAVGETSGVFPFEVSFQATTEVRGTDLAPVYEWDFDGDGVYEVVTNVASISHVFSSPGRHSVGLHVTAGDYEVKSVYVDDCLFHDGTQKRQGPDFRPALHRIAEAQRSVNSPSRGSVGSVSKEVGFCNGSFGENCEKVQDEAGKARCVA